MRYRKKRSSSLGSFIVMGFILGLLAVIVYAIFIKTGTSKAAKPTQFTESDLQLQLTEKLGKESSRYLEAVDRPQTKAGSVVIMDYGTGRVLWGVNEHQRLDPSSMSKLMVLYIIFDKLKKGEIKITDTVRVSERAYKKTGSTMFLELNSLVTVQDMLKGIVIQSGNDACVAMAEFISGSEESFVKLMNSYSAKLGLNDSSFANPTGLIHPNHKMSMQDLATLARRMIMDFPDFYPLFKEKEFIWNKIKQPNRNPLLNYDSRVDGLKTGHEDTGYSLTFSFKQDDMRLITVLFGLKTEKERKAEAINFLNYGLRQFSNYTLVSKTNQQTVEVRYGQKSLTIAPALDLKLTLNRTERDKVTIETILDSKLVAPIVKGQQVGLVRVRVYDNTPPIEIPLVAMNDVEKKNWLLTLFE